MKKNLISLLLCAALVLSLCACGGADLPRSVTAEEQLAETGIALYPPVTAEDISYQMVKSPTNGKAIGEVSFVWNGSTYCYRAEKTNKTEPYDFSGIKWSGPAEEGIFGSDDREGTAFAHDNGGYLCWIENGAAYLVYSTDTNDMFDIFDVGHDIAYMDSWGGQVEDPDYVDDGEYSVRESTPVENMTGTWRFDGVGVFVRINNFTYELFNPDGSPVDAVVRFWEPVPDDDHTIRLLQENGSSLYMTLTIDDAEWGEETVVNHAGEPAHRWDGAMDGTYDSYMSSFYLDSGSLSVMDLDKFYLRDEVVQNLRPGDTLQLSPGGFFDFTVESVEKVSDTEYLLNGETTVRYDSVRCAWQIVDDGITAYSAVGAAPLSESMAFTDLIDRTQTDLAAALEAHGSAYATVTVERGEVTAVEINEEF